jgi:hypothetical protein
MAFAALQTHSRQRSCLEFCPHRRRLVSANKRGFERAWRDAFTARFFPSIRILHPLPCHRFDARTQGTSPVR